MGQAKDLVVRWFTFEAFHAKNNIGSTRLRTHNLIKHWEEAGLYKYGENPNVMIYQKVLMTLDWQFPRYFKGIQILDICDPEWKESPDILLKETMDNMDAIVVPTIEWQEYLQTMTDKPVRVIKDRFDLSEFPKPKIHIGPIRKAVWFGYAHNSVSMQFVVPSLESRGIELICVSNEDPMMWRLANDPRMYEKRYKFIKYEHPDAYKAIQQGDIAVLPKTNRPLDRFKSENKTITANLLGLPVVDNTEQLEAMQSSSERNKHIEEIIGKLRAEYNVKKSIREYKGLINEIRTNRR